MRILLIVLTLQLLPINGSAQDLEGILDAHYKAAAQEKLRKVETIVIRGKNVYTIAQIESSFIMYQGRPNNIRVEGEFQGSKVVQTFNGERGWIYAPAMGIAEPKEMKDEELESIVIQSKFENPLWNYNEKGYSLELEGTSSDGLAHHLKLTTENDELNFFIDKESHLISAIKSVQIMGGSETNIEIVPTEYKTIKGIPTAMSVVTKLNGEVVTTVDIETIEYNKKLDPALFEKPTTD